MSETTTFCAPAKPKGKAKFTPLADRVMIRPIKEDEVLDSGLVLPAGVLEKPLQGKVIAVGLGLPLENGTLRPMTVQEGDKVLYPKYGGTEIQLEGIGSEKYLIFPEKDILGIVSYE